MPTPNANFDQFTGLRGGDINNILIAVLNSVFDSANGKIRIGAISSTDANLYGWNGATWEKVSAANVQKDLATVTITTITTVWTPASGKKFRLLGGSISVSAAGSVLFEDNAAATTVFRTPKLAADAPYNFVVMGGQGYLSAAVNNVLKATLSVAGTVTGTLWGLEE